MFIVKIYLDSRLCQSDPRGEVFPHEHVRVVRPCEAPLELVELGRREPGPVTFLLRELRLGVLVLVLVHHDGVHCSLNLRRGSLTIHVNRLPIIWKQGKSIKLTRCALEISLRS